MPRISIPGPPTKFAQEPEAVALIDLAAPSYPPYVQAATVYRHKQAGTQPPDDLLAPLHDWPTSRSMTPSWDIGKIKGRRDLLQVLALHFHARGLPLGSQARSAFASAARDEARARLELAVASNAGSGTVDGDRCFLADRLSIPEVQTLIFVAYPLAEDRPARFVSLLALYGSKAALSFVQTVLPALGVESVSDLLSACESHDAVLDLFRNAAELDTLGGFDSLLEGSRFPTARRQLLRSPSPQPVTSADRPRPKAKAQMPDGAESLLYHLVSMRRYIAKIFETLALKDKSFETAIFGTQPTVAIDLELNVLGRSDDPVGTWMGKVTIAAAGPVPQAAVGNPLAGAQVFLAAKTADDTFVLLDIAENDAVVSRASGESRRQALLSLLERATNGYTRAVFVYSTKLIDLIPFYDALELADLLDFDRMAPRHSDTFLGVRGSFEIFVKGAVEPLVFVNFYPLVVRSLNVADLPDGVLQGRGQKDLSDALFASSLSLSHAQLPSVTAKASGYRVPAAEPAGVDASTRKKANKAVADVVQEGRLVSVFRDLMRTVRRERLGGVELLDAQYFASARRPPMESVQAATSAEASSSFTDAASAASAPTPRQTGFAPDMDVKLGSGSLKMLRTVLSRLRRYEKTVQEGEEDGDEPISSDRKRQRGNSPGKAAPLRSGTRQ